MTKQDTINLGQTEQDANTMPDTTGSGTLLSKPIALLQLIVFSTIGLVMFFVPLPLVTKVRFCSTMVPLIWSISSIHYL